MAATKDDALKALDEALADAIKQGFANLVADAAGAGGRPGAVDEAAKQFANGLRLKLECHARAATAIGKVIP